MKLNETRESAHLRSRVTDLSVVPNLVSYNALLACITPLASQNVEFSEADSTYKPMLIRDVDTLISNFGDPRIDPEKYVDLYAVMRMINNGGTCYLAKVHSGNGGKYLKTFNKEFNATQAPSDGNTDPGTTDPGTTEGGEYAITTINTSVNKEWNLEAIADSNGKVWKTKKAIFDDSIGDSITGAKLVSTVDSSVVPLAIVANDPVGDQIKIDPNPFNTASPYNKGNASPLTFTFSEQIDFTNHTLSLEVPTARRFGTVISSDGNSLLFGDDNTFMPDDYELIYIVASDNQTQIEVSKVAAISKLNEPEKGHYYKITFDGSVTLDSSNHKSCNITFYKKSTTATGAKKSPLRATADPDVTPKDDTSDEDKVSPITIIASSALDSEVEITYHLASLTPTGIKTVCLFVEAKKKDDGFKLGSTRVVLTPTLTNGEIISALNSKLGTYIHFELYEDDQQYADCALSSVDGRDQHSIVKILNCGAKEKFFVKNPTTHIYEAQAVEIKSTDIGASISAPGSSATFKVSLEDYRKALDQYKDKRYNGCILADMTSKVTKVDATKGTQTLKPMSADELRTLHYYLKGIAAERKDCTVLLSTPEDINTISAACDFALSQASDSTKWEYGETPTTDYTLQSFYLEMYYPWLKIKCTKLGGTTPVSVNETIAPTAIVLDNILKSYRERGVHYPVAGDQYGQLSDTFSVINNPKTKFDRDQLVRARINPIWDTGKRGIQIYGNETLNAGYTDLNAAHIARTLVYIRNKIDEYTETLKFNINSVILWNRWKSYVSDYILEPLKSENALSDYEVMMGEDTTTREEIANRMLKGKIKIIFYQAAEIFDLDSVVYSSSNVTIADAEAQI